MKQTLFLSSTLICCTAFSQQNYLDNYLSGTVTYSSIAGSSAQISQPRDLDFKPGTNELWVLNKGTSSGSGTVTIQNAGLSNQTSFYRIDSHVSHFMVYASAIAFGEDGTFGCISEIQNTNPSSATFMGPSLLSCDTAIYAQVFQSNWASNKPLGSHLDMLHQSPFGMGIAYDNAHQYWVFDGYNGNICKYDFNVGHGPGNDDHSDGEIWRYTGVTVTRTPNVPSHMVVDKANSWLYFIDGGSKTLKRLNINSGTVGSNLTPPSSGSEPLALYKSMTGATVETIETFSTQPCGVDYYNNRLIVSDYTNGNIAIYNTSGATLVKLGTISTGQAGIMGVKVGPDGKIWFVNYTANTVVRMNPQSPCADDAGIENITSPAVTDYETNYFGIKADFCNSSITPVVTLINNGSNTLTSVTINYTIDNGSPVSFNWAGSLSSNATTSVTLPSGTVTGGAHKLTVYTSSPNGVADPNPANDTKAGSFRVEQWSAFPFSEGFSASAFPPAGWDYIDIGNPEAFMSRIANVGGFGNNTGCVRMDNYSASSDVSGQVDYLQSPMIDLTTAPASGTVLEFSVAYRQYDASTNDELKVLASVDCGNTWATIYSKSGSTLSTATASTSAFTTPSASQWRKETISLTPYVGQNLIFTFKTTSAYGNNLFIDDINVTNPALGIAEHGALNNVITYPNPASDYLTIEGENGILIDSKISLLNIIGEEIMNTSSKYNYMNLDVSSVSNGVYLLSIQTRDGAVLKKIVINK